MGVGQARSAFSKKLGNAEQGFSKRAQKRFLECRAPPFHSTGTPMHPTENVAGPAAAPRYNMYAFIHKALRAFMGDTLSGIGRMDPDDAADLEGGIDQLRELLDLCRLHLEHENRFVHPALEACAPGSSSQVAGEHVHHAADIDALDELADAVVLAPAGAARAAAANRLYRQLAVFVGINFEHMDYE